jgi:hypothetical protein
MARQETFDHRESTRDSCLRSACRTRRRRVADGSDGSSSSHRSRDTTLYEHPSGERFLRVRTSTALLHEEHDPIPVPPGTYRIVQQREYHPTQIAFVED